MKSKKKLSIDRYNFFFLNQIIYEGENANSNIIYFTYHQYRFLLEADATSENEQEILSKYNLSNITFLKVGHHGSDTSSSEIFINTINPKISLISVGANNLYHHPKPEVLRRLKQSKIYRTDQNGSIEISIKNTSKIKYYAP